MSRIQSGETLLAISSYKMQKLLVILGRFEHLRLSSDELNLKKLKENLFGHKNDYRFKYFEIIVNRLSVKRKVKMRSFEF